MITPAAGEDRTAMVESDTVTAVAGVADERATLVSLLEHSTQTERALFVAMGRVIDPVDAALKSVCLNGHKMRHFGAYTRGLGAPLATFTGPFGAIFSGAATQQYGGEVRFFQMFHEDFEARVINLDRAALTNVIHALQTLGVVYSTFARYRLEPPPGVVLTGVASQPYLSGSFPRADITVLISVVLP